jgi:uncharacterized pyridoxal phosphate-containing UPF0001 family protein
MLLPPFFEDPEQARPMFKCLRDLAAAIESRKLPNVSLQELSMGMSHDFEVAIEEGATMVRIGTAIYGPRVRQAYPEEKLSEENSKGISKDKNEDD